MIVVDGRNSSRDEVHDKVWAKTPSLPTRLLLNLFVVSFVVNVVEFRYAEFRSLPAMSPACGEPAEPSNGL